MTRARDLASLGDNTSKLEQQGLVKIIPSSVAVGSGTGSVSATGLVTFSGVSSVSLNDVFSSTYDNYVIIYDAAGIDYNNLRLRVSGTDASGANYTEQILESYATTVAAARRTSQTSVRSSYATSQVEVYVYNPNKATTTHIKSNVIINENSLWFAYGAHAVSTSYTGFTLFPTSSTLTGTITVYGRF
jgi:hypothetical protein